MSRKEEYERITGHKMPENTGQSIQQQARNTYKSGLLPSEEESLNKVLQKLNDN